MPRAFVESAFALRKIPTVKRRLPLLAALLGVGLLTASGLALGSDWLRGRRAESRQTEVLGQNYNPLELAAKTAGQAEHREAGIPAQCYTKTEGRSNPCWTCHTDTHFPNDMHDWTLQKEYAFSEQGVENHWQNLFLDTRVLAQSLSDAEVLAYVRADNYAPLAREMKRVEGFPGYVPDLDFARGFDDAGFALDGSQWRAFRYKPFPGTFWPTNGSTDDVLVRLPAPFRSKNGAPDRAVYQANLALLEASVASDPSRLDADVRHPIEPLDEQAIGFDLNRDGRLDRSVTEIVGIPDHYVGDAATIRLRRGLFPKDTEFLHSVRYLDPDRPELISKRMKELRYSRKLSNFEPSQILGIYADEHDERDAGKLPVYQGDAFSGVRNDYGWSLQGYIEDQFGRLRLQTDQEHLACMGCHTNLGVTVDGTFAFVRKVPGKTGWAYQDVRGIPDVPQLGHSEPEFLTYLKRVGGGDEFRANAEILERFFEEGRVNEAEIRRGAAGGDKDFAWLVAPSRARALDLNRAYMALVRTQRFDLGRDAPLAPVTNVLRRIEEESTGLEASNAVYRDGRLHLAWPR